MEVWRPAFLGASSFEVWRFGVFGILEMCKFEGFEVWRFGGFEVSRFGSFEVCRFGGFEV